MPQPAVESCEYLHGRLECPDDSYITIDKTTVSFGYNTEASCGTPAAKAECYANQYKVASFIVSG